MPGLKSLERKNGPNSVYFWLGMSSFLLADSGRGILAAFLVCCEAFVRLIQQFGLYLHLHCRCMLPVEGAYPHTAVNHTIWMNNRPFSHQYGISSCCQEFTLLVTKPQTNYKLHRKFEIGAFYCKAPFFSLVHIWIIISLYEYNSLFYLFLPYY